MAIWKTGCLGAAIVLGSSLLIGQASAMPASGLAIAAGLVADNIQDVRWVCGPYRCWWTPGPYWWGPRHYGFYGPYRHWGWRHGWRRWWG
jgi:hypothetical protein